MTRTNERPAGRGAWIALAGGALFSWWLLGGALEGLDRIGGHDWNAFLGQTQAEAACIERYGSFPHWNPWRRGGQVGFAQAESMFLSPALPLALAFGANLAFKLLLLPVHLAGCLGAFLLAGRLGLRGAARVAPALVFFGCGLYPLFVVGGTPNWLFGMALLPWLVLAVREAREPSASGLRRGWIVCAAVLFALLLFCGSIYHFVFFPLFLAVEALVEALRARSPRPVLVLAACIAVAAPIAAARLLPLYELYRVYPRDVVSGGSRLSLELAARSLLEPTLPDLHDTRAALVHESDGGAWHNVTQSGAFVGFGVLVLALAGALARPRRGAAFVLLAAVFLWLACGSGAWPSGWDALHRLPLFSSMRGADRLLLQAVFCIAFLAGLGVEAAGIAGGAAVRRMGFPRHARAAAMAAALLALAAAVVPMVRVTRPIAGEAFYLPPPEGSAPDAPFRQVARPPRPGQWGGDLYGAVLRNEGNPLGQTDVPTAPAVRSVGEPGYRGEVYLEGRRGDVRATLAPGRIDVAVNCSAPDVLVVNQNWFPGWSVVRQGGNDGAAGRADALAVRARDGLIAVALDAGAHDLRLVYAPASAARGFAVSGAALVVAAAWLLLARRPASRRAARVLDGAAFGAFAALLASIPATTAAARMPAEEQWTAPPAGDTVRVGPAALPEALARARPGDRLLLEPGEYAPFVLARGVELVATAPGDALVRGKSAIAAVPAGENVLVSGIAFTATAGSALRIGDCSGQVLLHDVRVTRAPAAADASDHDAALEIDDAARVLVLGGDVRAEGGGAGIAVRRATVIAAEGRFAGTVALRGEEALVLLNGTELSAGEPCIVLDRSRAVFERVAATRASGAAVPLVLDARGGSFARLSGCAADADRSQTSGGARFVVENVPLLRMEPSRRGLARIEIIGPPGVRGVLLLGDAAGVVPLRGTLNHLLVDVRSWHAEIPVEIPASGRLVVEPEAAPSEAESLPPVFAQFGIERALLEPNAAAGERVFSLLGGVLPEPAVR